MEKLEQAREIEEQDEGHRLLFDFNNIQKKDVYMMLKIQGLGSFWEKMDARKIAKDRTGRGLVGCSP